MENPIYVIGHKNPDPDSVCSAIAYCALKEALGEKNYIPARCGNVTERTKAILDTFQVPTPLFLGDVTPRVRDIMIPTNQIHKVSLQSTCAEALEIIDKYDVRAIPVTNSDSTIAGLISIFMLGEYFIPKPSDPSKMRNVRTNINSIIRSLKAQPVHLLNEESIEDLHIRVGATQGKDFGAFMKLDNSNPFQNIVVVGNHREVQEKAIDLGVRLLVITSKELDPEVVEKARKSNVSIITSPYDSATTAWVMRSATHIDSLINRDIHRFNPEETISSVRRKIVSKNSPIYFVANDDGQLLGIFSASDILKPAKTNIALVDHNEITQAVNGADEVNIIEIIDHHRLGNPPTKAPIRFINEPLGSTCTIIANMFRKEGITPSKAIAGILMGGMITDTLNLKSPTTTKVDKELLPWLGTIAGINPDNFANTIFSSGSIILGQSPEAVIETDCKIYHEADYHFSVSQVEEPGFDNFWSKADHILNALEAYRVKENLMFSVLLVTDINSQNSLLLIKGDEEHVEKITYTQLEKRPIFDLPGIVSRKKQLIPYLTAILTEGISH